MNSAGLTIMRDYLRRVCWWFLAAFLGTNVLSFFALVTITVPWMVYTPFKPDSAAVSMLITTVQFSLFALALPLLAVQSVPSQLYTLPIRTSTIVAWRLLPAMLLFALGVTITTAVQLWATFHRLPLGAITVMVTEARGYERHFEPMESVAGMILGTALFAAAGLAAAQMSLWLGHRSAWAVAILAGFIAFLSGWYRWQFGPLFVEPKSLWLEVTLADFLVLSMVAAMGLGGAVFGLKRMRSGAPPLSIGFFDYLANLLRWRETTIGAFRSRWSAHFWFEWRQKAWVMPTLLLAGLLYGAIFWIGSGGRYHDLAMGSLFAGMALPVMGLIGGIAVGASGMHNRRVEMGSFLGARPMTTQAMANATLLVAGASVLVTWAVWISSASLLTAFPAKRDLLHPGLGSLPSIGETLQMGAIILLATWSTLALSMCVGLAGRQWLTLWVLCGLPLLVLIVGGLGAALLNDIARVTYGNLISMTVGIAGSVLTVACYVAAWRAGYVRGRMLIGAAALWAGLTAFLAWYGAGALNPAVFYVLIIGLCGLIVAPVAAAPLALAWNRTR